MTSTFADANLVHVLPPGTATFLSPTRTLHCNDLVLTDFASSSTSRPKPPPQSPAVLSAAPEPTINVLTATVEAAVPLVKARNPRYAHRWWNDELDAACREARRLRNQARTAVARGWAGAEEKLLRAKVASNRKKALLRRSKREFETAEAKAITEANASSPSAKLEMLRPLLLPPSNPAQRRRGGDRQDN